MILLMIVICILMRTMVLKIEYLLIQSKTGQLIKELKYIELL